MESMRWETRALCDAGVEVEVFANEDSDSATDLATWEPLPVSLARTIGPSRFGFAPSLPEALVTAQLEVVSTHGLWRYTSRATSLWHARTGKPYVVSPHGMLDPWALRNSPKRKRAAGWLFEDRHLDRANCLRALCQSEATAIRDYGLRNPVAIIPNGVVLPELDGNPVPGWSRVDSLAGARILLSIGRLHPKKNLLALIQGWKQLRDARARGIDEWRLVIAGWDEGGYAGELKACVDALGLTSQVWLPGPLFGQEKEAAYRNASAFIIPSLSEGLPMVVLEAWSYALPVLMTAECNLPEGFAARAALPMGTSAEAMATTLADLFLLNNPEKTAMGQRGRELCARDFNWPRIATQTKELLHWVLGEKARPDFVSR